ncbi:MAG TPA: NAD(P)-dependent alcohol dehydrogenase [Geobacterales bacterium]|nr:NAD(P)-dependent alcohol dehydrogenase [Geobacterales bacterium]
MKAALIVDYLKPLSIQELPFVLGHENVGYIEEKGDAVDWLDEGDPVILHPLITCRHCRSCRLGDDMHCTNSKFPGLDGTNGGFAEYMLSSAYSAIKLPKGIDPVPLAPLADAGVTAYHAAKKLVPKLYPGTFVGVIGIGGLGHIAIQVLKSITPAKIVAIDITEERLRFAKDMGADYAFLVNDAEKEIEKITDRTGLDAILDFVGEHNTPSLALKILKRGGVYSIIGYGGEFRNLTVDFIVREISVIGNLVGTYTELAELVELYNQGKVKLKIQRFQLESINELLEDLKKGKIIGRAVIEPK